MVFSRVSAGYAAMQAAISCSVCSGNVPVGTGAGTEDRSGMIGKVGFGTVAM
jgi:hypothetical protein